MLTLRDGKIVDMQGCATRQQAERFARRRPGFTSRQLKTEQFRDLPAYGIGRDDLYDDADELRAHGSSRRARGLSASTATRRSAGSRNRRGSHGRGDETRQVAMRNSARRASGRQATAPGTRASTGRSGSMIFARCWRLGASRLGSGSGTG